MPQQIDHHGGGHGLRDIWSAITDVTRSINALTTRLTGGASGTSALALSAPTTVTTATYTALATDTGIIAAGVATLTLTLVPASTASGQLLFIKNTVNFAINSATANVVPLVGGAAGTGIIVATAGKWAILISDGSNWQLMASN